MGRGRGKEKRKRGPRFSPPLHLPSDACHTHCTCNIMIINVLSCLEPALATKSSPISMSFGHPGKMKNGGTYKNYYSISFEC